VTFRGVLLALPCAGGEDVGSAHTLRVYAADVVPFLPLAPLLDSSRILSFLSQRPSGGWDDNPPPLDFVGAAVVDYPLPLVMGQGQFLFLAPEFTPLPSLAEAAAFACAPPPSLTRHKLGYYLQAAGGEGCRVEIRTARALMEVRGGVVKLSVSLTGLDLVLGWVTRQVDCSILWRPCKWRGTG
jgi:hypothetical protein